MTDFDDDYHDDYDYPASACRACDGHGETCVDGQLVGCPYCEGTGIVDDGYVSADAGPLRVPFMEAARVR